MELVIWVATAIMAVAIGYAMRVLPVVLGFPEGRYFICGPGVMPTILALNRVGVISLRVVGAQEKRLIFTTHGHAIDPSA